MSNNNIVFDALRICITEGKCTNTDCPYEMFCKFKGREQYVQIPKSLALDVLNELKEQEAVVRCKDCKHYDKDMIYCNKFGIQNIDNDWFCADGERKEGR